MIVSARRIDPPFQKSRTRQKALRTGITYERKFVQTLKKFVGSEIVVEHNPWFAYLDDIRGNHVCAPDALVRFRNGATLVIEVKYTWVEEAIKKLVEIYCPVVDIALSCASRPLVVVKRLTPESPMPRLQLLGKGEPLFQWSGFETITL